MSMGGSLDAEVDGITIDTARFNDAVARTLAYSGKSMEEELRSQARGVMREILAITPPRAARGAFSSAGSAEKGARAKLARDLVGGPSTGRRGTRRAGVFVVVRDDLIDGAIETQTYDSENVRLWTRRDGTVYGTQRRFFRPDAGVEEMRAHHKRYFHNGKMSTAGTYERGIGRWKWIDQMIVRASTFERYLRVIEPRIGWYAGGWGPGARALGVPVPAYARRNSSAPGAIDIRIGANRMQITISNRVDWPRLDRDVQRRVQWAVDQQARKMERRLPYLIRAAARVSGLGA